MTRYAYDLAGQLTEKALERPEPAADPTWRWTYAPAGDVETMTDPDGRETDYAHDPAGNLSAIDYPGTSTDATFAYDADGHMTEATNPLGTIALGYDALGRLVHEQLPGGSSIVRDYDRAGNLTALTLPGGDARAFEYDAANRVTAVTASNGRSEYDYDTGGRLDGLRFPRQGERTEYDYDPLGRIATVANWRGADQLIDELTYAYDKAGNTTAVGSSGDQASFAYDALNRLTQETHSSGAPLSQSFAYDAAGNRLSTTRDGQTTNYGYDELGRLVQAGPTIYTYNDSGEQQTATTGGQTTNYSWQPNGQLAAVDLPGSAADVNYGYDPLDRRSRITRNGTTTERLFTGDEIAQTNDATATRRFIRDPANRLLASSADGDHRSYHLDAHGSVRALVDDTGTVTDSYSYTAFGEPRTTPSAAQPFGYLAQEHDPQTGLYDFRARAYDPVTARFTGRDPVAGDATLPASLNPYQYGYNNPLGYKDTDGRWSIEIPGTGIRIGYPSGNSYGDALKRTTIEAISDATYAALNAGEELLCSACHYLRTRSESLDFNFWAFAASGALDFAKPLKILRLGRAAQGGKAFSPFARRADELPRLDRTGKVHGDLPGGIPGHWTRSDLEEFAADLRGSIRTRQTEQTRLGEHGPHRARINEEQQLLRQIEKRLSGS